MSVRVTVDADLCIGSGDCTRVARGAFALDEASGVSVPTPEAAETDPQLLVLAARGCPTQAIQLVRATTGEGA